MKKDGTSADVCVHADQGFFDHKIKPEKSKEYLYFRIHKYLCEEKDYKKSRYYINLHRANFNNKSFQKEFNFTALPHNCHFSTTSSTPLKKTATTTYETPQPQASLSTKRKSNQHLFTNLTAPLTSTASSVSKMVISTAKKLKRKGTDALMKLMISPLQTAEDISKSREQEQVLDVDSSTTFSACPHDQVLSHAAEQQVEELHHGLPNINGISSSPQSLQHEDVLARVLFTVDPHTGEEPCSDFFLNKPDQEYPALANFNIPMEDHGRAISIRSTLLLELFDFLLKVGSPKTIRSDILAIVKVLERKTGNHDDEDMEPIRILFSDLARTMIKAKIPLTFKHSNNKEGTLINVPRSQKIKAFFDGANKSGWVRNIIAQAAVIPPPDEDDEEDNDHHIDQEGRLDSSAENIGVSWLCSYFAKEYEDNFCEVAMKLGLVAVRKMSKEAAAAMWSDANVPMATARIILRHLRAAFGFHIQVPEKQLNSFSRNIVSVVKPNFGSLLYYKNDKKVVDLGRNLLPLPTDEKRYRKARPERVDYVMFDCNRLIAEDVKRLILLKTSQSQHHQLIEQLKSGTKPTYGYPNVDVIIGSDHNGGSSRFIAKVNLASSQARQEAGHVEYGSWVIPFGNIWCRKDEAAILQAVSPQVNQMIESIKNGRLLGVAGIECNDLDVIFIPRAVSDQSVITVGDKVFLKWVEGQSVKRRELHLSPNNLNYEMWNIIPGFCLFVCGDLAYYATIQGRDGSSGTRCPYCEISLAHCKTNEAKAAFLSNSKSTDKQQICQVCPRLTLERMKELGKKAEEQTSQPQRRCETGNLKGFKSKPQLEVEPDCLISPLLHQQIGMVNYAWAALNSYLDNRVELVSGDERNVRDKLTELVDRVEDLKDEDTFVGSEKEILWEELTTLRNELKKSSKTIRSLMKRMKRNEGNFEGTVQLLQKKHDELDSKFVSAKFFHKECINKVEEIKQEMKVKRAEIKKLKEKKLAYQKQRLQEEMSLDSLVESALMKYEIKPQAFHGGAMNGVCTKRLLYNCKEIINDVRKISLKRLGEEENESDGRCSREELENILDKYSNLFLVLDITFALLCTLAPTAEEIQEAKRAIQVLQVMWKSLRFNVTPKAHILFTHTVEQFEKYGGIADKVEDFVEKAHQQGKRLEYIVSRMPKQCYNQQQQTIFKRIWTDLDPEVNEQKKAVYEKTRRKRKAPPKQTSHEQKMIERKRRRKLTTQSLFFTNILAESARDACYNNNNNNNNIAIASPSDNQEEAAVLVPM